MSAKSNYLEKAVLDHVLGTSAMTSPTVYLSLYTTNPAEDDSGTELSGNGYARQAVSFNAASSGAGSATGPTVAKDFTASGGNWGTVTHFGLHDGSTAGGSPDNLLYYGELSEDKLIEDGDTLRFAADSITITEA
jgi:hypothetical protein